MKNIKGTQTTLKTSPSDASPRKSITHRSDVLRECTRPGTEEPCPEEPLRWALVELVGYQQFAGIISDETVDGKPYVKLEVPATKVHKAFDCKFGIESVHRITPIPQQQAEEIIKQRERGRFALNFDQLVENGSYCIPDRKKEVTHE